MGGPGSGRNPGYKARADKDMKELIRLRIRKAPSKLMKFSGSVIPPSQRGRK
jgi:hypothetical protein